jgi:ribosomal-protein-alanine N-acetyltransferase
VSWRTISSARLELVSLSADVLEAMLAGRRDDVASLAGIDVPDGWPGDDLRRFLELRAAQMRTDSSAQRWLVRAMALREPERPMIGHIGFHGPPGVNGLRRRGALEIGYTVFEPYRGEGYASEAVTALIEWAREEGIEDFVASVAPSNKPSLAIVTKLGFVETGRQWDEEDGEELVFEL